jgi:multicomponent Na+:H+ antiporter subunit G
MTILGFASAISVLAGLFFYIAGTIGLIRFPDPHSRLHALTKADTLGLGLVALGAALHMGGTWTAAKLMLVWCLTLFAAATIAQLIARAGPRGEPK